jgi:hypothetical protein
MTITGKNGKPISVNTPPIANDLAGLKAWFDVFSSKTRSVERPGLVHSLKLVFGALNSPEPYPALQLIEDEPDTASPTVFSPTSDSWRCAPTV